VGVDVSCKSEKGGNMGLFSPQYLWIHLIIVVGDIYWLWLSFKIGSVWMFILGVSPVFMITALIGAWSLFFSVPEWIYRVFG
jgi:hypothetical protein